MISLGTHQAATWGYSVRDIAPLAGAYGSASYIGLFTKPTLAPNGNMYAILGATAFNVSGTYEAFVIMKIVPGTSNTATTNYTPPTISYLVADNGVTANGSGFAKPSWGAPSAVSSNTTDNALFRFNTGILASNGLIYFPPAQCGSNDNKWVIFNPNSELWKVTDMLRPSGATFITNRAISSAVLGTDNKIYVFSVYAQSFRITTTSNASADTVEDSYYSNYFATTAPFGQSVLSWRDEAGTTYTDYPDTTGFTPAYATDSAGSNSASARNFTAISDAIVHPSGCIYLMPGKGRGRIFYVKQSAWGTSGELVSAPNLRTTYTGMTKNIQIQSAFLEKPRDASHDINTLKIYCVPRIAVDTQANLNVSNGILVLDPVTQTMNIIAMSYSVNTTSGSFSNMSKLITLPNGMVMTFNKSTSISNDYGGTVLTGWDVPSSAVDGVRK